MMSGQSRQIGPGGQVDQVGQGGNEVEAPGAGSRGGGTDGVKDGGVGPSGGNEVEALKNDATVDLGSNGVGARGGDTDGVVGTCGGGDDGVAGALGG